MSGQQEVLLVSELIPPDMTVCRRALAIGSLNRRADRIISSLWPEQSRRYDGDAVGTPVGGVSGGDDDRVGEVIAKLVA